MNWAQECADHGAAFAIVVHDTLEDEDYVVYAYDRDELNLLKNEYNRGGQVVKAVYTPDGLL